MIWADKGIYNTTGEDPLPRGCKKLTGQDMWRSWVGDYYAIYEVDGDERVVTAFHIGHRRDV
ncbi:MAG: type II toxin-antitoxin system RelE/ParE family toxin [Euryarchaeota archaeon]|nr:type II toxin-antitoxin system RelE/ParE family toxin [Euryarchaeota archaeon]